MSFRQVISSRSIFNSYSGKANNFKSKLSNIQLPKRWEGTFVERWALYWKNLYKDYRDVAVDVVKESKEKPLKAIVYVSILGGLVHLAKHNPDENTFKQQLLENSIKVMQVGESIRNRETAKHLKLMRQSYNEGLVRRLNLGVVSFIWVDNYDSNCAVYKATCSYLKPRYVTFYERIVDVGFYDRWRYLDQVMIDYDVNEEEFKNVTTS